MIHDLNPSGLLEGKRLRGISISDADYAMINRFCSGNQSMDDFLKREALWAGIQREASTTLVVDGEECISYFTIKDDFVEIEMDGEINKYPCLELARLAVSEGRQHSGIGGAVLSFVKSLALAVNAKYIATQALLEKVDWYRQQGFEEYASLGSGQQATLYMIMELYDSEMEDDYFKQFEPDDGNC